MKRKVIQIAESTQLISLPRKWAVEHGIKKGDELEIDAQGDKLTISTEKYSERLQRTCIDITELDRSSILFVIRAAYRKGHDEIELRFRNTTTQYYRTKEEIGVVSVIHEEVRRLIGIEVVEQKEQSCLIKTVSEADFREFDTLLRRVFLLLIDALGDLIEGIEKKDGVRVQMIEEKHNTITKFVSYCLRLLNKKGHPDYRNVNIYYHIIANLDTIMDAIKYSGREFLKNSPIFKPEEMQILKTIQEIFITYHAFFYLFSMESVKQIYQKRDQVLEKMYKGMKTIPIERFVIIHQTAQILELLVDMTEERTAIEF